ncbi:MAG TPA: S24/S26 family peptidase [Terriglobales bacterium]|nr:S24/S26 family peptidase [Terriglobales bacterium]
MSIRTRDECGCSLAAEVLEQNGTVRVRVFGQSMLPTLWPGDVLTIQSQKLAAAATGDLVLYQRQGRFFVHRLISKSAANDAFITRGDCMTKSDPVASAANFLGTIRTIRRGRAEIMPKRKLSPAIRMLALGLSWSGLLQRAALRIHRSSAERKPLLPELRELRDGIE